MVVAIFRIIYEVHMSMLFNIKVKIFIFLLDGHVVVPSISPNDVDYWV